MIGLLLTDQIRRIVSGIVITEWKRVQTGATPKSIEKLTSNANKQLKDYTQGVLAHMELKNTRYIILVSLKRLDPINDIVEKGVTFRHINIVVNPNTPSGKSLKT